jgi:hypothetical protein
VLQGHFAKFFATEQVPKSQKNVKNGYSLHPPQPQGRNALRLFLRDFTGSRQFSSLKIHSKTKKKQKTPLSRNFHQKEMLSRKM